MDFQPKPSARQRPHNVPRYSHQPTAGQRCSPCSVAVSDSASENSRLMRYGISWTKHKSYNSVYIFYIYIYKYMDISQLMVGWWFMLVNVLFGFGGHLPMNSCSPFQQKKILMMVNHHTWKSLATIFLSPVGNSEFPPFFYSKVYHLPKGSTIFYMVATTSRAHLNSILFQSS